MGAVDPNSKHPSAKWPLWVAAANTSISAEVKAAAEIVKKHQLLYGIDHLPCEQRNTQQGYMARCCICTHHTGCLTRKPSSGSVNKV